MLSVLYFGSFNPLHLGHVAIAKYVLSLPEVEHFRFIVSPKSPFKEIETLQNANERLVALSNSIKKLNEHNGVITKVLHNYNIAKVLHNYNSTSTNNSSSNSANNNCYNTTPLQELLQKPLSHNKRFEVSNIEFTLPSPLYTCNTILEIKKNEPNNKFVLLMGSDNILSFEKWYNYKEILKNCQIWVYPREGYESTEICKKLGARLLNGSTINISSTLIRSCTDFTDWKF